MSTVLTLGLAQSAEKSPLWGWTPNLHTLFSSVVSSFPCRWTGHEYVSSVATAMKVLLLCSPGAPEGEKLGWKWIACVTLSLPDNDSNFISSHHHGNQMVLFIPTFQLSELRHNVEDGLVLHVSCFHVACGHLCMLHVSGKKSMSMRVCVVLG